MNSLKKQIGCAIFFLLAIETTLPAEQINLQAQSLMDSLKDIVNAHADMSEVVKLYTVRKLIPIITHETFIKETIAQNDKNISLTEIQEVDNQWIKAEEEMPFHIEKLNNECAKELKALTIANPHIVEVFVMDNQGALVCTNRITTDYWQGDEPKWQNAYNKGLGGLDVGKIQFDKSANAVLQQISLPLIGMNNKVIGAITFGLDVTKMDAAKIE